MKCPHCLKEIDLSCPCPAEMHFSIGVKEFLALIPPSATKTRLVRGIKNAGIDTMPALVAALEGGTLKYEPNVGKKSLELLRQWLPRVEHEQLTIQ